MKEKKVLKINGLIEYLYNLSENLKSKIELKEGFEFLQPEVDAGKYIGEYSEEHGGYINWEIEEVIMKDGNIYCAWKAKEITERNKQ